MLKTYLYRKSIMVQQHMKEEMQMIIIKDNSVRLRIKLTNNVQVAMMIVCRILKIINRTSIRYFRRTLKHYLN